MAESKSQDPKKTEALSVAFEEQITDEELDQAISEQDPEFLKSIDEIGRDKDLSVSQIEITDEEQALFEEKQRWAKAGGPRKALFRILPFMPLLTLKLKKVHFFIFSRLRAAWIRIKNFFYFLATTGKNQILGALREVGQRMQEGLSATIKGFVKLKWRLKVFLFAILFLMIGTGLVIYQSWTHGILPQHEELFMPTMERVSSAVVDYDPVNEVEPFYENLRAAQNLLLLPRMVVNLKRSLRSGPTPMGAFELFVEGMAPEAIIEVKDREVEVRDLVQRVLEGFTFEQVETVEGKRVLCEKVKKEVNLLLTTGKLKKIWFKTVIIKP